MDLIIDMPLFPRLAVLVLQGWFDSPRKNIKTHVDIKCLWFCFPNNWWAVKRTKTKSWIFIDCGSIILHTHTCTQRKMNVFVVQLIYLYCYASLILTINLFTHLSYAVLESTAVQSFSCKTLRIIACCVLHVVRWSLYYSYTLATHFFPVLKIQKTEVNRRHTHATGKKRVKDW